MKTLIFFLLFVFTAIFTCEAQPAGHLPYYERYTIFNQLDKDDQASLALHCFIMFAAPEKTEADFDFTPCGALAVFFRLPSHYSFQFTQQMILRVVKANEEIIDFTGLEYMEGHSLYAGIFTVKHSGGPNRGKTSRVGISYPTDKRQPEFFIAAFK